MNRKQTHCADFDFNARMKQVLDNLGQRVINMLGSI